MSALVSPAPSGPRRLLLLAPTHSYRIGDFAKATGKLGLQLSVATDDAVLFSALTPGAGLEVDFLDLDDSVARIERFAMEHPIDVVLATDDSVVLLAAKAAERLGLATNPTRSVEYTVDKEQLRIKLAEAGLPYPWFRVMDARDDPALIAPELAYPAVIKPAGLAMSRGVMRVDSPAEFEAAVLRLREILDAIPTELRRACHQRVIIEGYIDGPEVAVEAYCDDGVVKPLAIFDKPDPLVGPTFAETFYTTPSRHPEHVQKAILARVQQAVDALGLRQGPIHAELRLPAEGPMLLEIAARTIGGLCGRTLRFGSGHSLEELVLMQAAGYDVSGMERDAGAAGVLMLPMPHAGTYQGIRGREEALAVPNIEGLEMTTFKGEKVRPLPESDRYLGFLFAKAERPEDVEDALREAWDLLRLDIDDDDEDDGMAERGEVLS